MRLFSFRLIPSSRLRRPTRAIRRLIIRSIRKLTSSILLKRQRQRQRLRPLQLKLRPLQLRLLPLRLLPLRRLQLRLLQLRLLLRLLQLRLRLPLPPLIRRNLR